MYALIAAVKTSNTKIKSFSTQIKINTILSILFPGRIAPNEICHKNKRLDDVGNKVGWLNE